MNNKHKMPPVTFGISGKPLVLLADGDEFTVTMYQRALSKNGFSVAVAQTYEDIVQFVRQHAVQALIFDAHFCGNKKGLSFIQSIKTASKNPNLKLILTRVVLWEEEVKQSVANHIDHVLIKPIPPQRMVHEIKDLMEVSGRKDPRKSTKMQAYVAIHNPNEASMDALTANNAFISDLSISGMFVETTLARLPIGALLTVQFCLPRHKKPFQVQAIIVRRTEEGYGLMMIDLDLEIKEKIAKFVAS